jgi:hypothetical protein
MLYWINKYLLLRRAKRPEELSGLLAAFFANLLPWAIFLWTLSMTLFYQVIIEEIYKIEGSNTAHLKTMPAYVSLGIAVFIVIFPIRFIFIYLFEKCLPL